MFLYFLENCGYISLFQLMNIYTNAKPKRSSAFCHISLMKIRTQHMRFKAKRQYVYNYSYLLIILCRRSDVIHVNLALHILGPFLSVICRFSTFHAF